MASVCGVGKNKFSDASHILCDGNLNNPFFSKIAIQKINKISGSTIETDHGKFEIKNNPRGEFIEIIFNDLIFGKIKTTGYPFKDENTPTISEEKYEYFTSNTQKEMV